MFIDELKIYTSAGKGGDGVVRWRCERGKPKMGPSGGNGGRGGDIYVRAVRDISVLSRYLNKKEFCAENGGDGMKDSMHGKNGDDFIIDLPMGSIVTDLKDDKKFELTKEGEQVLILRGGKGGLGNERFKSSINTTPKEFTLGKKGEDSEFFIELQLVVDAGFIGLPSAGKSSLLNEITGAKARVADYPFTTLEPNLGDFYGFVLADIPGLIEGASQGKGLGYKFLRHIKRTKMLIHCISLESDDTIRDYNVIRDELKKFDLELLEKKEIIVLTKTDLVAEKKVLEIKKEIKKLNPKTDILTVSILDDDSVKNFSNDLIK
ncbi:GTPase ObgE, partial [Patescibacteria group bacterium]|nr:GTPase ObgE [Patescibacteria group bacterium]